MREARELFDLGIRGLALFPVTPTELKTPDGREALNPDCLVLRAVRAIKAAVPELVLFTDIESSVTRLVNCGPLATGGERRSDVCR